MKKLILFCIIAFLTMLSATIWASLDRNVLKALEEFLSDPWLIATLIDTYLGFIWFFLWVCHKENHIFTKILWAVLIICLGNIIMPLYLILKIYKERPKSFAQLVCRRNSGAIA